MGPSLDLSLDDRPGIARKSSPSRILQCVFLRDPRSSRNPHSRLARHPCRPHDRPPRKLGLKPRRWSKTPTWSPISSRFPSIAGLPDSIQYQSGHHPNTKLGSDATSCRDHAAPQSPLQLLQSPGRASQAGWWVEILPNLSRITQKTPKLVKQIDV